MAGSAREDTITCSHCRVEIPATAVFCPHCGSSTIPARAATPVLPGYTILRLLGRGGAASVYLARQESLDRLVAVKVLRRDVEDPRVWREFRREAHTIARLSSHPHVVTVHTAGRSAIGQPYLVTEFLDRGSLGDLIAARGALDPQTVTGIGMAVADALSAAHDLGILHRDVKPGNVLLGHDGRIKLGDFGIARLLVGQSGATTDQIAFTPEHVAPEVLRNESDGPWSDVYGLASTLATALSGAAPFVQRPDERMETFLSRRVLTPPPALPRSVPAAIAAPVTRALDPDPSRRPSVVQFRDQLAGIASSSGRSAPLPPPIPVKPSSPPSEAAPTRTIAQRASPTGHSPSRQAVDGRSERWRRHVDRFLIAAAVLVALGAAALIVASLRSRDDAGRAAPTAASPPGSVAAGSTTSESTATVAAADPAEQPAPPTTPPQAVVTPAPSLVAVATTEPARGSTAPTTTSAPTTAAPGDGPFAVSEVEPFVRSYYDAVAAGEYARSWSQLTPEFQRGKARSYDYYVDFWNRNHIEVGAVDVVATGPDRILVDVDLRWNGNTDFVTDRFELVPGPDGQPLIASQQTVDR